MTSRLINSRRRAAGVDDYVELRAVSAFSFLRASSNPEDLVTRAAELGMDSLALCDRDGLAGAPRFFKAARSVGIKPIVGADVDFEGSRVALYVQSQAGYRNLCRLITESKLATATIDTFEQHREGLLCITRAGREIDRLVGLFGLRNVYVELWRHLDRDEERRNHQLIDLARKHRLPAVVTNDVRHARQDGKPLLDVLTCLREKTTLDDAGRLLTRNAERFLKPPAEITALFRDLPKVIATTREVADRCEFTLENLGYQFPRYPVPAGETLFSYLHKLTQEGARNRYRPLTRKAAAQISRELDLIAKLDLAGYFLIVWDIVRFCRQENILTQGRGSAANSAVCYSLGITAVDPVGMDLLFERFLSEERGEWPDIDLDLPSGDQRERVIQYVYERYGQRGAAMTSTVVTYRARLAARELGKALGLSPGHIDRLTKALGPFEYADDENGLAAQVKSTGLDPDDRRVKLLVRLCREIQGLPRHLSQHPGGMVIAAGRLDEVAPLQPATMPDRVVLQWDKDDCADLGILKIDLLGLGMMALLEEAVPLIRKHDGIDIDLARLPPDDPKTYRMIQKADTIGVFQIESRAQMATLPRMKPERFYDLVVEVAIIRPGPIVGQMVHPYLERRNGRQPVRYPHPSLEPILKRTLGVPIFQEQIMRLAMVAAGFSGGQAEELRRAMGFRRSEQRIEALVGQLVTGMTRKGISPPAQEEILKAIRSFALYGFPESHAASFALLAYASAYLKAHHPAAFYTAILNKWPMGFYHPATLVKDAQRRGVRMLPACVASSHWLCTIEDAAVRIGLRYVKGLREHSAEAIVRRRPFSHLGDLTRHLSLNSDEITVLAESGALASLGKSRRDALWQVLRLTRGGPLLHTKQESQSPLPGMSPIENTMADYHSMGLTTDAHPMAHLREELRRRGVAAAADLENTPHGCRVKIAGNVIVKQRPGTAKGFLFLTLEDETGISNAILKPEIYHRERSTVLSARCLIIEGRLQKLDGTIAVQAQKFESLDVGLATTPAREFR